MMNPTLLQSASTLLVAALLFLLLICFYLLGYWTRSRGIKKNPHQSKVKLGTINGTLLGLLGLLLAFTFNMASSRFDTRRQVVIEEANSIGTAILRADIYPDSMRQLLRNDFKNYVEERIAFYQAGKDGEEAAEHYHKADVLSKKVWSTVTTYAKRDNITTRTSEMVPALNAMIDVTTSRRAAGEATVPDSIMYFLFALCCCSAFLLGYDNKYKIDWIVVTGFAVMLSLTVYTIIDLDRPRSGLINMDAPNEKIIELRGMFEGD